MPTARASERIRRSWSTVSWEADHDRVATGVRCMLDDGADPNETFADTYGQNSGIQVRPIAKAAREGHDEAVRLLVAAGADVDGDTDFTLEALRSSIIGGHPGTAMLLLDLGASPDPRRHDTASSLWRAFRHAADGAGVGARIRPCAVELIHRIAATGVDPTTIGSSGSIVHAAAISERPDVVVPLAVAMGCPVDALGPSRRTPLRESVERHHHDSITALIAAGADIHATDVAGWTLLENAMESTVHGDGTVTVGGIGVISVLLDAGMPCRPPRTLRRGRIFHAAMERALAESGDRGAVIAWCMRSMRLAKPGPLPERAAEPAVRAWATTGAAAYIGEPWAMRLFAAMGTAP